MKQTESILKSSGKTDKKNILNQYKKLVDTKYLQQIEQGVTLEELDTMQNDGLPIFRYQTQITIHGIFDDLSNNCIHGYANLFQNKNRSIGVKYNAIDEDKRQRIAARLQTIGFKYNRNSTSTGFTKTMRVNKDNIEAVKAEFTALSERFDKSLFFGSAHVWLGNLWGQFFMVLDVNINAIYEYNIEPLLLGVGATVEMFEVQERKRQQEDDKRNADRKAELEASKEKREIELIIHSDKIKHLKATYPVVEKSKELGMYVKPKFTYEDKLIYLAIHVYEIKGKKLPRWSKQEFTTMQEALNSDHSTAKSYDINIFKGNVTAYKIK